MKKSDTIKLLAIDDQPDNLTALTTVVQKALPQTLVLTATNGLDGIELAAAEDPDVILLDIVMPGMDGFEVCRRLKADDRIKDIPVVFLTALMVDTAGRVKALEAGSEGFLTKPLETTDLIAQIRAMTKVKAANRSQRTEKERLEALVAERTRMLRLELTERKQAEKVLEHQRKTYEQILEHSLAGYWDWDIPTGEEYLSPIFKKMFGYEDHEIENRAESWQKLIFAEDLPGIYEKFNQHIESKGKIPFYNEVRYHHKNGSTVWVICTGKVIEWAEDGTAIRMVGCHIDISERKRAEEALRESKELHEQLASDSRTIAWRTDADGLYTFISAAAETILGYPQDEIVGKLHFYDLHPEEGREDFKEMAFAAIQRQGDISKLDNPLQAKDGRNASSGLSAGMTV